MKQTFQVLLRLRDEGELEKFAVGGAIAASFYIEAVATEDLDIFAVLPPSGSGEVVLTPLHDRLSELGATVRAEHVLIHDWPVQIFPAYTPLVEEAVRNAQEQRYEGLAVPVVTADYLCAIALQTGRPKDYLRVYSLLQAGCVAPAKLRQLIKTYGLKERWNAYAHRYA
ncbi:MAG: hypothetical protein ACKVQK_23520 [Burkholderiales bacterium]